MGSYAAAQKEAFKVFVRFSFSVARSFVPLIRMCEEATSVFFSRFIVTVSIKMHLFLVIDTRT